MARAVQELKHTLLLDESCNMDACDVCVPDWSVTVELERVIISTASEHAVHFTRGEFRDIVARIRKSWKELDEDRRARKCLNGDEVR